MKRIRALSRLRFKFLALAFAAAAAWAPSLHAQSLYDERTFQPLAADHKALRVGDLLTIQVMERSTATSTTDTSTQRNNSLSLSADLKTTSRARHGALGLGVGGTFDGGGSTQRTDKLLTTLTVTVKEILPNGDLRVGGEQLLTVNGEKHKVQIEGRVRSQDISGDNVVPSTRLADAKILYVGEGDLSARQKRALWRKIADFLGF